MTLETFIARIEAGKANNLVYAANENEGLVAVWKHERSYILTWEECPAGEQFDESTYTRDERHQFESVEQMLEFLAQHGLKYQVFKP